MARGFFVNLLLEIAINILSWLPPRTVIRCKCVCKSWLKLLDTREFVKLHLSKSVPGMAVVRSNVETNSYEIFEFEDKLDLERHHLRYSSVTKFVFPRAALIRGSANGLLFLTGKRPCELYVCNPITRRFIKLRPNIDSPRSSSDKVAYGFGVTKTTGQHKVVRIVYDYKFETKDSPNIRLTESRCEVYTLGTRTWRSVIPVALILFDRIGIFLNGNLHWLVADPSTPPQISCFDLETELFSTFFHPSLVNGGSVGSLSALAGSLCLCDNSSEEKIIIWVLGEYGDETSWTKEYVIKKDRDVCRDYMLVSPIKIFEDGDILMEYEEDLLFYYSDKTKTIRKIEMSCLKLVVEIIFV
ncbi:F-box protein CPR1-like [Salvia hispanica]|uniref:F-box protein CPR1-like n=1 Tax=Salvia hispanica TaxID=49212 RepID=UPI0020099A6A|nr:F-box protein CPR1-like [Salvia hispanica]XP_047958240.1 F-box protein CPR1-like [Salvia hispanica]XP_047958242.1 F-box protein CPR1-like [Salvia hispanica]XP_047958243.1 F-box protein CPR1-like [Salvia hispanica]XP_047958244.1 F-box protein CPR1-like [Salvia hispanica]XP_047958245.1 F-box protein CPR1-like [Salvia hispanica]